MVGLSHGTDGMEVCYKHLSTEFKILPSKILGKSRFRTPLHCNHKFQLFDVTIFKKTDERSDH